MGSSLERNFMRRFRGCAYLSVVYLLVLTIHSDAGWKQTSGPGAGQILAIAVEGTTVFAGLLFIGTFLNWIYNPARTRLAELDSSEY